MAINVKLGEAQTQEKDFPKLMKNEDGSIWYFVRMNYGLPLNGSWDLQCIDLANWKNMKNFTDYNEPITLQNA